MIRNPLEGISLADQVFSMGTQPEAGQPLSDPLDKIESPKLRKRAEQILPHLERVRGYLEGEAGMAVIDHLRSEYEAALESEQDTYVDELAVMADDDQYKLDFNARIKAYLKAKQSSSRHKDFTEDEARRDIIRSDVEKSVQGTKMHEWRTMIENGGDVDEDDKDQLVTSILEVVSVRSKDWEPTDATYGIRELTRDLDDEIDDSAAMDGSPLAFARAYLTDTGRRGLRRAKSLWGNLREGSRALFAAGRQDGSTMTARVSAFIGSTFFAIGERFPTPKRKDGETDEEYRKRVERRGAIKVTAAIGAVALAGLAWRLHGGFIHSGGDGSATNDLLNNRGATTGLGGAGDVADQAPVVVPEGAAWSFDETEITGSAGSGIVAETPEAAPVPSAPPIEFDEVPSEVFSEAARTIDAGEGLYQTFKDMGISSDHWHDLIEKVGPDLHEIRYSNDVSVAYYDTAHQEWRLNVPPNGEHLPDQALWRITEVADQNDYLSFDLAPDAAGSELTETDADAIHDGTVTTESTDTPVGLQSDIHSIDTADDLFATTDVSEQDGGGVDTPTPQATSPNGPEATSAAVRSMSAAEINAFASKYGASREQIAQFVNSHYKELKDLTYTGSTTPIISFGNGGWSLNAMPEGSKLPDQVVQSVKKALADTSQPSAWLKDASTSIFNR